MRCWLLCELLRVVCEVPYLDSKFHECLFLSYQHNVKVAALSETIKRSLGRRYQELRDNLTTVKRDAKAIASTTSDWRPLILNKYPVLKAHPDLLERTAPYDAPKDADASDGIVAAGGRNAV